METGCRLAAIWTTGSPVFGAAYGDLSTVGNFLSRGINGISLSLCLSFMTLSTKFLARTRTSLGTLYILEPRLNPEAEATQGPSLNLSHKRYHNLFVLFLEKKVALDTSSPNFSGHSPSLQCFAFTNRSCPCTLH